MKNNKKDMISYILLDTQYQPLKMINGGEKGGESVWQTGKEVITHSRITLEFLKLHRPLLSTNVPSLFLCQKPLLYGEVYYGDVIPSHLPKNGLKTTALSNGVNRVLIRTQKCDGQH